MLNTWKKLRPKAGEWVEVRSADEILATLDAEGKLNGLPFMPEMLQFAGMRFKVLARADKTCDTISQTGGRRLVNTVHLETRCDGSAHGGCQASCLLFWKEEWLKRPADRSTTTATPKKGGVDVETLQLVTLRRGGKPDEEPRYRCQATELLEATTPLPWWDVRQYWRDWRSGNVRLPHLLRVLAMAMFNAVQRRRGGAFGFPTIPGRTVTTTTERKLGLQPGDLVKVKNIQEIVNTLDANSKLRGLWFDAEMVRYCGGTYRVEQRVDQIIDERSGKMLRFKNDCIMLEGVACESEHSRGRLCCPRRIKSYWRESWLQRAAECEARYNPASLETPEPTPVGAAT